MLRLTSIKHQNQRRTPTNTFFFKVENSEVFFQSDLKTNCGRFCSWVAKNDEYDERTFVTLLGACFCWIQRILDLKIRDPRAENL